MTRALLVLVGLCVTGAHPALAQTPQSRLWDAAMAGDTVAITRALDDGARVDSLDVRRSPNGRRALNWAAWYNRPAAIRVLLARGAGIDATNLTGNTALHHAAESGSRDAAAALLAAGADRSVANEQGQLPEDVALAHRNLDVATLLQQKPAN